MQQLWLIWSPDGVWRIADLRTLWDELGMKVVSAGQVDSEVKTKHMWMAIYFVLMDLAHCFVLSLLDQKPKWLAIKL